MSSKPIFQVLNELPAKSMTTRLLGVLDWVVPGQYKNIVGFDNSIKVIAREDDEKIVQKIGERAIALFNDKSQGYQRALWLYQSVDTLQGVAGFAVIANKLGNDFSFLSALKYITPKAQTTQILDLGVKLVVELIAFCQLNGIPGDSFADFVKSLSDYRNESLMRMAALICFDGLMPLGPDFFSMVMGMLQKHGVTDLEKNERFQQVKALIPGEGAAAQMGFIQKSFGAVEGWVKSFVASRQLSAGKVVDNLKGFSDGIAGKLDYLSAFIDLTTNYYSHTGTQSVARSLITRAASEI
jgi:hypothetical protein